MVDIDSETLFNGAAAVLATVAVLFFVFNVQWGYSPVSKVALVLLFLSGVFALTQRTDDYQLTLLGYGVVVVSFVGLFFEVVSAFGAGDAVTVVGLLLLAAALFFVRTRLDEDERFVAGRRATYAVGVVAVLTVAVLLVDVTTGGLAYELQPASDVEFAESHDERMLVASVVVTNPTPLPERVETPNYEVCAAGNWSEYRPPSEPGHPERSVHVSAYVEDGYDEHVSPFGTKTYPVELNINGANLTGETFPVERTSACPDDEEGSPYVAIFEAEQDRYGRPVAL
ncbi:hypothetical protein [Halopelagius longus]|uniref:DUF1109 domain-containing protein n=1 Tax=Halopelagius longus TaxID=1236180 RepID=A0A1H0YDD2_9EURY|nr:hypothetical protein [Halopelagius longus]RDI72426.1 hypothetical protein DWB78_12265 [Halopelagius longus]SDQ13167.1 hypothetical protein SAMN05216278_0568 [Halopelagius longus]